MVYRRCFLWAGLAGSLLLAGCSPKRMAVNAVADMLSSSPSGLGAEEDPELLRDATPFALVTLESLARSAPDHVGLRLSLASGFTQYAYAYADLEAELVKFDNYTQHQALQARARKLYLRGHRWGLEGLELNHPGFKAKLQADPKAAVAGCGKKDLELLYWTGASQLAAISISVDSVELIAQLPQAVAMLERVQAVDPDYDQGGLHEIFVALDMSRTAAEGGGLEVALKHYARALELSKGQKASVYVGYASSVAVKLQDRKAFDEALEKALAMDVEAAPAYRLVNLLAQKKALFLQAHAEDLFEGSDPALEGGE